MFKNFVAASKRQIVFLHGRAFPTRRHLTSSFIAPHLQHHWLEFTHSELRTRSCVLSLFVHCERAAASPPLLFRTGSSLSVKGTPARFFPLPVTSRRTQGVGNNSPGDNWLTVLTSSLIGVIITSSISTTSLTMASPIVAPAAPAAVPAVTSKLDADIAELESMGFPSASVHIALQLHPYSLSAATTFLLSDDSARWIAAYEFLSSMGFSSPQIKLGLEKTKGNGEQAMEWILGAEEREKRAASGHSQRPAEPVQLVTEKFSDEQVRADLLVHRAVFARDTQALGEYCKRGLANSRDHHGRTPLLLAHHLGFDEIVAFLLNRGADPRLKMPRGWSLLQQACLQGQRALALDIHLHTLLLKQSEWDQSQKHLLASLERMDDFTMSINWEIKSWVPLLGRLAPKDSFTIWKKGAMLRMDSNVRGMQGMQVQRGLISYLFTRGSVWLVDHVAKTYSDALADFRQPDYDDMQHHVAWLLSKDSTSRSEINTDAVEFKPVKTLMRGQKYETIEQFKCKVVQMTGLRFVDIKTKDNKAEAAAADDADDDGEVSVAAASSSASALPVSSSSSNLDASTYFSAPNLVAYNRRRKRQERKERKMNRRLDAAFEELEAKQGSSDGAANSSASSGVAAASSSAAAPASAAVPAVSLRRPSSSSRPSSARPSEDEASEEEKEDAQASGSAVGSDDSAADDGIQLKTASVDATLCLSPDFPLPLSHLLILLDLLSPASSNLAKLRDILAVELPTESDGRAPFPVRLTFPVFTQVNACVTFGQYEPQPRGKIDDAVFAIPADFQSRSR